MAKHKHDFRVHLGLPTSFGGVAWVDERFVSIPSTNVIRPPQMFRCAGCGEPGYEVPVFHSHGAKEQA